MAFWLVSALFLGVGAIAANPASDAESGFVGRIGDERVAAGLAGYTVAPDLVEVARRHADEMRRQQRLHHNPRLAEDAHGWQTLGENVGVGPTVEAIHQKLMESPTHRDNILSGRFTEVGVGVVADGPDLWIVQVFRLPRAAEPAGSAEPTSSPPPADSGSPAPAPAPEPRPSGPASPSTGAGVRAASNGARPPVTPLTSAVTPSTTPEPVETVAVPATVVPTSLVESAPTTVGNTPSVEAPLPTAPPSGAATVVETDARSVGERQVTWPVGLAATMLLGVVGALAVHVGGDRVRSIATTAGRRRSLLDVWDLALAG